MERSNPSDGEAAVASAIPSSFGKYEILLHLASGGMADIFLSRARGIHGFEKLAIIKRVRQDRALDKKMVDLFLDEARLAASLQHPNIVQVYEFGIVEGSYFLAMEYVHGEDAHALLKRMRETSSAIPLAEVLTIAVGVCQGLHYAHECMGPSGQHLGIVHRDISPSNVLVSYDGAVMITDFGIAMATGRSTRTTTGTVRGKLSYMSPEQCRGLPLDRRSDIFAVGILLHELSTGQPLFPGAADFDVMKAVVEEPIPAPSTGMPGYPPELERIVMKALARHPADRYATARELQLDLERFAVEHKLAISSARLAGFMQESFADRIAAWRERVAARAPSAEVEIVEATAPMTTRVDATPPAAVRRRRIGSVVAAVCALAAIGVVAQRRLATSHVAVAPPKSVVAPVSKATPPAPAPAPAAPTPPPTTVAAPTPPPATAAARAATARSTHSPVAPIRHRHTQHETRPATKSVATPTAPHAQPEWNPEDGLPPGAPR
jgi:tRNA A-37 threonylcarbamoyl transferase component Bud32